MYRYEVQLLGRDTSDFERHLKAVEEADLLGPVGFRSYFFAGIRNMVVLLSTRDDVDRVVRAVPHNAVVGCWQTPRPVARAA